MYIFHVSALPDLHQIVLEAKGQYQDYLKKIESCGDISGLRDFTDKMELYLLTPIALQEKTLSQRHKHTGNWELSGILSEEERNLLAKKVLSPYTMLELLKCSKHWHDRIDHFQRNIESAAPDAARTTWAPLTEPVTAPNGVTITPLSSAKTLKKEGADMHHCVGGYASQCMYQTQHICSLRLEENGETIARSTLQLRESASEKGKRTLTHVQNNAEWNKTPDPRLQKAAEWYVDAIHNGKIDIDWENIDAHRRNNQKIRNISSLGFDPYNPEKCAEIFDVFKDYLKKSDKRLTLAQWEEKTGVRQMIAGFLKDTCSTQYQRQEIRPAPRPL